MIRDWISITLAEVATDHRLSTLSMAVYLSPGEGEADDLDKRGPWPGRLPWVGRPPAAAPNEEGHHV